jgi:hypothetical protein
MSEIDAGIVEKVARAICMASPIPQNPDFQMVDDDCIIGDDGCVIADGFIDVDCMVENPTFHPRWRDYANAARTAIAAYEEAKAEISPQDAFDLLNRLEAARLERVESTWALGTTQTQK